MKVQGHKEIEILECINPYRNKWSIRWNIKPEKETEDSVDLVNYEEETFHHQPTIQEIKTVITNWINYKVNSRIIKEFIWNNHPVWLSTENQFNYKAAYDLAVQTAGKSLPATFKFGTDEEPVWYKFTTLEELMDFYTAMIGFIQQAVEQGWQEKKDFDFSVYEKLLPQTEKEINDEQ